MSLLKKTNKLLTTPGVFFRDYFLKKYPDVFNEISCAQDEEHILIKHDLLLENKITVDFPIDVVFTWVDDSDPVWRSKYELYQCDSTHVYGQYATDPARFSNNNELYYSIKSVVEYLPWVRTIFLVTDNQKPSWLDEYPKVKLIDHSEIIPGKYLPTFNSHVIEAHLHNIPSLSEHFIYFNDDVFVARPLPVGHFFRGNGISSLFLSQKSISSMKNRGVVTPTLSASIRVCELVKKDYGLDIDMPLTHTYIPLRKSIFKLVWDNYQDEVDAFFPNKFRTDSDLNLATFMVPWVAYIYGLSIPARDICHYFNIRSISSRKNYALLKKLKNKEDIRPHSFCANDVTATNNGYGDYKLELLTLLRVFYGGKN